MPLATSATQLTISDNAGNTIVDSNLTDVVSFQINWTTAMTDMTGFDDPWRVSAADTALRAPNVWVNGVEVPIVGGTITVASSNGPTSETVYGWSWQDAVGRWITYDELFRGEEPEVPRLGGAVQQAPAMDSHVVRAAQVVENPAMKRSKELFLSMLTPAQREQFHKESCFDIVTNLGNKMRIFSYVSRNIHVVEGQGKGQCLCAHPQGEHASVPLYDVLLTQKLRLETDEVAFRRIANVSASYIRL